MKMKIAGAKKTCCFNVFYLLKRQKLILSSKNSSTKHVFIISVPILSIMEYQVIRRKSAIEKMHTPSVAKMTN